MYKQDEELKKEIENLLSLFKRLEFLERTAVDQLETIERLEAENRKLKFEYNDSLLERDQPKPYKWRKGKGGFTQYCPKCEMIISNWQRYCASCGQKIGQGNPVPEMEIKENAGYGKGEL